MLWAVVFPNARTEDILEYALGGCVVVGIFIVAMTAIGVRAWQRHRDREAAQEQASVEASLKERMLGQGMSADEICRVLGAKLAETLPQRRA